MLQAVGDEVEFEQDQIFGTMSEQLCVKRCYVVDFQFCYLTISFASHHIVSTDLLIRI